MENHQNNLNKKFRFEQSENWKQEADKLKEKYSQLTDEDLDYQKGQEPELFNRIKTKLNKDDEEVHRILNQNREQNFGGQNQNQNSPQDNQNREQNPGNNQNQDQNRSDENQTGKVF